MRSDYMQRKSGLPRHRENREFEFSFFPDRENTGNWPKILKRCFYTGEFTSREIFDILKIKGYTRIGVAHSYNLLALKEILSWGITQ